MTEHKYAEILRAIADGKQLQHRYTNELDWEDASAGQALALIQNDLGDLLRAKPPVVMVNGVECPVSSNSGEEMVKVTVHLGRHTRVKTLSFQTHADALKVFAALIAPFDTSHGVELWPPYKPQALP